MNHYWHNGKRLEGSLLMEVILAHNTPERGPPYVIPSLLCIQSPPSITNVLNLR